MLQKPVIDLKREFYPARVNSTYMQRSAQLATLLFSKASGTAVTQTFHINVRKFIQDLGGDFSNKLRTLYLS